MNQKCRKKFQSFYRAGHLLLGMGLALECGSHSDSPLERTDFPWPKGINGEHPSASGCDLPLSRND